MHTKYEILFLKSNILKILLLLVFITSSCAPEFKNKDTELNTEEATIDNTTISSDFDWKTYTDIELTMTANSSNIVKVASATGLVYQQAYLSKDNAYKMKLTLPTHERSVRLLFNGQNIKIDISSGYAKYTFQ